MAPFMKRYENGNKGVNWIRILESVISGAIIAGLTTWILVYKTTLILNEKVDSIKCNVAEIKAVLSNHEERIRDAEIKFAAHAGKGRP